jgi:hypothetical protein
MLFSSWLRNGKRSATAVRRRIPTSARQQISFLPRLEALEDRCLPSGLPFPTAANVSQLIADINYADKTGGAFTINLKPSTTFDLKSVNNATNHGANGLPVISGTKAVNLTIVGRDTIERVGSKSFRLWDVAPQASLTLDHVTLKQGLASGSGGAVYNQGTLSVSNGTVSNFSGGGISNSGGTVTISNSTLSGNAATFGGGIANNGGTVIVRNCSLSSNNASNGGGIYNAGGTVMLSNSILSSNSAAYGGGISNAGGTVTASNSFLSGNYATPDYFGHGGYGGGIDNSGGTVIISASILTANHSGAFGLSSSGGGVYNDSRGTVRVQNSSSITGNTSGTGEDVSIEDVQNLGVLYLDGTSTIGILDGNPALPI